uniref:Reverse transcriptase n=1 Tax=Solanum tuberosum TaxID=4113 RepID=M1D6X1_SOLTU
MPSCLASYLPEGISDHCPAKVYLKNHTIRTRRAFQYCNVWSQHPQLNDKSRAVWTTHVEGCKIWKVVKRLKLLKPCLKKLNAQYFRNIVTEASEDRDALIEDQHKLHIDPLNKSLQEEEKVKHDKYRYTSYMAERFLQQQSKATWLKLGDNCTRYFFSVIKHQRLQQAITQVKDDQVE